MITPAQRAEIRRLSLGEHWKIGTIAAALGVHHETVRRASKRTQFGESIRSSKVSSIATIRSSVGMSSMSALRSVPGPGTGTITSAPVSLAVIAGAVGALGPGLTTQAARWLWDIFLCSLLLESCDRPLRTGGGSPWSGRPGSVSWSHLEHITYPRINVNTVLAR